MIYKYTQTCPTFFGLGAVQKVPELAKELKMTKVMIVSDPGVQQAGHTERVSKLLKEAGIDSLVYTDITEDPKDHEVIRMAEAMTAEKVDGIIAVGGGSPMDAAKAANILTANHGPLDYWYYTAGHVAEQKRGLPLICVPSNSGTGSENTAFGVVSYTGDDDPEIGKKGAKKVVLYTADYAVYDPELSYTCDAAKTAASGMDALAHAAEAMTCKEEICNPKSDVLAAAAIKEIMKWLPVACSEPDNKEARYHMALGANLAAQAFNDTCCNYGHAFSQCLGAKFHVTHGISCAWGLPETMRYNATQCPQRVRKVAEAMGLKNFADLDDAQLGQALADHLRKFMRGMHIQSPKDYGLSREQVISIWDMMLNDNCFVCIPGPVLPTGEEVQQWLGQVYDTYQ